MESVAKERHNKLTAAVFGLMLIVVGVLFLLDNLGIYEAGRLRDYWPVFLIALGIPGLVAPRDAGDLPWGVVSVAAGTFFLLKNLDVIDWRFRDIWPLFLVLAGMALVARALADRRGQSAAGSGSAENGGTR